jgi:hypothetical protein
MALTRGGRAAAALAALTVREAARQRLWVAFVAVGIVLAVACARLDAVDASARLKLGVVVVTTGLGFLATLLAMLVGASQLRRDLDARLSVMLFAKPVPRAAYLAGRWLGVLTWLAMGLAALAVLAAVVISVSFGGSPEMRRLAVPDGWREVTALSETVPVKETRMRLMLGGVPGNGVRWHLAGLHAPAGDGLELLLRVDARPVDREEGLDHVAVQVQAWAPERAPQLVKVDPLSPYGRGEDDAGRVLMRARDASHHDLSQDYCRLRLPASCISPSGESWVQVVRLDATAALSVDRDGSLYAAVPGGSFLLNLLRASAVMLAQAALLCGVTLLIACVSNLAVSLLGGLTLYFAGNALWALRETLEFGDPGQTAQRLLHLALAITPDFGAERFGVAAQLAAGQAVGWDVVGGAWLYYGAFTAVALIAAWIALLRREL